MKRGNGCTVDAVELRKLQVTRTATGVSISAVFALLDSRTGSVVAWRKKTSAWPADKVLPALTALTDILEEAVVSETFREGDGESAEEMTIPGFLQSAGVKS